MQARDGSGYFAAAASLLLCAACSSSSAPIRALMQAPIVPASDAIFGAVVYTNGQLATAPSSDADWQRLQDHATSLEAAAAQLRTLAPMEAPKIWLETTDAFARASSSVRAAAAARDLEGVLDAGSRLYDACTACHATYAKDPIDSTR